MNYRIGFATCEDFAELTAPEKKFSEYIKASGIEIEPVVWTNPGNDYSKFDLLVIRSCWDYHLHSVKFSDWLNILEEQNVRVLNPVKTLRKNMHKFYLRELKEKGVKILDTVFISKESNHDLARTLESKKWKEAVIKPAVSGSAYKTFLVSGENISYGQSLLDESLRESDILLQEFAPQICSAGEWSLIFFNKVYSHTVLKLPKENDFRVQVEHGGTYELKRAPVEIIQQAETVLNLLDDDLLYARVDGVILNGEFRLMELELLEPEIFLLNDDIMNSFAEALHLHLTNLL